MNLHTPPGKAGRVLWCVLLANVFLGSFLFRILDPSVEMEQYIRIVGARQILHGELPDRDFLNRGFTLMYYASAAAQALFGDGLLGDILMTGLFLAVAATFTLVLSRKASGSIPIAILATVTAVATYSALYNYPKVLIPVVGIFVMWRYVDRRTTGRLVVVAVVTAIAFLFRHDHGLYLGIGTTVMIVATHWRESYRSVARHLLIVGVATAMCVTPYVVFLTVNGRLVSHVKTSFWVGGRLAAQAGFYRPGFDIDLSQSLLLAREPTRIDVRWNENLTAETRTRREAAYGLMDPQPKGDSTWRYEVRDPSSTDIKAILGDPDVVDTGGIDRAQATLSARRDLRLSPGLLLPGNAKVWLYYVIVLMPPLCLLTIGLTRVRRVTWEALMPFESAKIITASIYCLVLHQALIRASLESRLADVTMPTAVLGAWFLGRVLRSGSLPATVWREKAAASPLWSLLTKVAATIVVCLTVWSAVTFGNFRAHLQAGGLLDGAHGVWASASDVVATYKNPTVDWWAPPNSRGMRAVTRYVAECTDKDDRLMLTWLEPRPYYFSKRLFAGGMFEYHLGWLSYPEDQALVVARLRAQRVPIVIADMSSFREDFATNYPIVNAFITEHYSVAAESGFGDPEAAFRVLVDPTITPVRRYGPLSLPCFK